MGDKTKALEAAPEKTTETAHPSTDNATPTISGTTTGQKLGGNMAMQRAAREDASARLKGALISQSIAAPATSVPSTATWLAGLGLATTIISDDTAEIASIDAQLASLVISDTHRAELEKKRAELELIGRVQKESAARIDLIALQKEAQQRAQNAADNSSHETTGPTKITVPLRTLFAVPQPYNQYALYFQIAADPSSPDAAALAARYISDQYLSKKLDWPVTIEIIQPEGGVWFEFSAQGQALVDSKDLKLPLSVLDLVSPETLFEVSKRGSLIVETASFEAAAMEMANTISKKAEEMIKDPEDYAHNEAQGLATVTYSYLRRLDELAKLCGPEQDWIRQKLEIRRRDMVPVVDRVKEMTTVTDDYHTKTVNDMPTYAGETYDRVVDESSNVVEEYGWRFWRFLGNTFTLGGQSTQAENARMYRRGEISRTEYKKNWVLAIVRVGVTAVITALTAGRATGPAMRFLGLGSGTAAAAVTAGGVEGVVGGLTGSISSDAFAKAVTLISDSPGVVAFHERTIGGPEAWLESMGWGGALGMGLGLGGHAFTRFSAKTPKSTQPNAQPRTLGDQPEPIGTKIKDDPNGDFAILTEDPASGKPLMIEGNHLAGNAQLVDPLTGEVIETIGSGPLDTGPVKTGGVEPPPGALSPAADSVVAPTAEPVVGPTEPVYGPVEKPPQMGPPAKPPQPAAVEAPISRTLEIEALIDSDTALFDPINAADPLDPNQFSVADQTPPVTSLAEVNLADMTLDQEAAYTTRFPNYIKETLAAGRMPRLGNLRDYIRFRYGLDSGQLARGFRAKLRPTGSKGMSIESRVAIDAGNVAEDTQGILRNSKKNNNMYSLNFFDQVRQKVVEKNVIPDFMPTGQRDAGGRFVNAGRPQDAVVIADSKYTWDPEGRVALDDQVAAMMVLARDNNKAFVFLLGEGRDVSASVRAFAQIENVEIYVVPDVSGTIR